MAWLALALGPLAASAENGPQVVLATPGTNGGAITRFTARFNQPIVPLGDPRAAGPFTIDCAVGGQGRWADQQTYVYEFAAPLPGGTRCGFELRAGLKSASGYAVVGQRRFTVDAGGPVARAVLPARYDGDIEEDQVFLVAAAMAPDRESVGANAYCSVDGIGEKIPVDVLAADLPGKLLGELGTDRYQVTNFLEEAGLPTALPGDARARASALKSVVALKCRRPLPPGRDMALVWSGAIRGAGGPPAGGDQRFDFTVRKPFTARFECSRVNPQAGCSPVEPAWVRFSSEIPIKLAQAITLTTADGRKLSPQVDTRGDDERGDAKLVVAVSEVRFAAPLPQDASATLTLPAGIADESGRPLANAQRFPLQVRFDAPPPLVKFAASFGILEAKEGGVLPVTVRAVEPALAGRNLPLGGQALRVDGADGEVARWLRTADKADDYKSHDVKRGGETVTINDTGAAPILGKGAGAPLELGLPGKGRAFEVVGIPLAKPGFYVVELASPVLGAALLGRAAPRYVASAALVTNLAVHFKWGRDRSLAWVTTLDGAKPVANAEIRVTDSCTGRLIARGATDRAGGLYVRGLPEPQTYGGCDGEGDAQHPLMISARTAGDFSFTLTQWGEGLRPYDFDLPFGYDAPGEIFHTVFDRTLVRQGETVHMKHIVRQPVAAGFARGKAFTGTLRLSHAGSGTEFDLPLEIDANGVGETSWTAPQGAPMGDYNLRVMRGGETIFTSQSFRVDEYRLPTMRASITGPKAALVKPKSVPLDLFVGFLSGGGAARLPVDLRVAWEESDDAPEGYEGYAFGGAPVKEGVRPLNGDGEEDVPPLPPVQTLPVTLDGQGSARPLVEVPAGLQGAATMRVEMDYQDANGEILTAARSLPVYPSAVRLGVKTDGWLMKADDLRLRFVALNVDGAPIRGQRIKVALYSRQILTARRRLIGGFYAYDNQAKTTKLAAGCTASTDAQGLAQCQIDPGVSGEVYAVATTQDAEGNVSQSVQSVWLAGEDDWWFGGDNGDRMDLIPERQTYKAGETARFQVRMPFRAATALVTVEREGVLASRVVQLSGKDPVVEVPMPGSYAPDVFVSVLAVRGRIEPGFWDWLGDIGAWLGITAKREPAGAPTALVDLAKPAYRLGIAKVRVGWEAHRLAVSVQADRERYAARQVAQVALQVKTPEGKPAPDADVAFVAVDEALLQLSPNDSWDVLTAMMGERSLSVLTATAQTQVVGKRHYGKKAVAAGGGGGDAAAAINRENFQPVLLWRGHVPLDAQGRARVAVPLSDALSRFKLVAIATQGAGAFGTGETAVRAAQDLSIFAGVPPIARAGDQFGAIFTLKNGSTKPMRVTAEVALTPAVATGRPQTVVIPAGGAAPIMWTLTAPPSPGTLRWQVRARAEGQPATDSISVTQQIEPLVPVETWAATLTRVGGAPLLLAPPTGALPGRGGVSVRLEDGLAPPLEGVRDYMRAYPYDCLEQQLSRIVALGDGAGWTRLAASLPSYQASDGLLRFWPSDTLEGSEALTAYVLSLTSAAGLAIPEAPRARMIDALRAVLDGRLKHESFGDARFTRFAAFAALARAGAASPAMLGQVQLTPAEMPTALLADYLMALDKLGAANGADLRRAGEAELRRRLVYEGTRIDLSDDAQPWWLLASEDLGAVKAALAVLGRPGWEADAPKLIVGVSLRQQRGAWDTTTANAWGAVFARGVAALYPPGAISGTTRLVLGPAEASRAWPLAAEARTVSLPLPPAREPLVMTQAGGASPWAFVALKAAVPLKAPLAAGYRLARKVELVQAKHPGRLTRGDVLRVTLTVSASAARNWVVVSDPVPPGASILGANANQSALLAEGEPGGPSYVERGGAMWRGYFAWLGEGETRVSYTVRLNGTGRFALPPSRVEAMYSPELHAALPNAPVAVGVN
ncbi:MAG: alpha-2-macroglobulin [Proteobacteria bacterium SG_bin5]|nr:MAG: alpha-2-macroglobulin [Proteobacteria bacterium SG_bin5]